MLCFKPVPAILLAAALSLHAQSVVNSADYSPASSTGIPRGALFTILGDSLAPSIASAGPPLHTTLNGVTVRVSSRGTFVEAPLLYVSPSQINAILPSDILPGPCSITVVTATREIPIGNCSVNSGRFAA